MKVMIDKDEYYPFYDADENWSMGKQVEVPDDVYAYWMGVMEEFFHVQAQMREYYKVA